MTVLGVELLGGFRLTQDGQLVTAVATSRLQALLAYLVLNGGSAVSRQHVAFLFWPDSGESQARTNLRQLLHHLRSALPEGEPRIESDAQTLRWSQEAPFTLDTSQFEAAVHRGGRDSLEEAARLYRGDLLPALYDEWIDAERQRLKRKHISALEQLLGLLEQAGELLAAIGCAETLLAQDALCEATYQTLMRLHARNGDRAAALHAYDRCAIALRRELEVAPGPATRQIRDHLMTVEAQAEASAPPLTDDSPLLGRDTAWARLLQIWREAARGRASFVLATGEAGIGKTRLMEEFIALAARHGVTTARTTCYAAERPMAFAAVADWLRSPSVRPALASLGVGQLSQLSRVLPEILTEHPELGPPAPLTESWQRHHFFEALAGALLRAPQPIILFIDDLQWCDRETMEWLHYLLRFDSGARLLIAGTARLDEVDKHHPVATMLRTLCRYERASEIALAPLSAPETASLAKRLSKAALDAESAAALFHQTNGNPLFIVETVRGGLVASPAIPAKVHAIITARLAQLSTGGQQVAEVAAVAGRPFTVELLVRAAAGDEEGVSRAIDELWQRRIIQAQGEEWYDFSHGQFREVAYAELGPARRRLLHRRVAEALEAVHAPDSDSVSAQIGGHYEKAGLGARAIPYFRQAAATAQRRYAEEEAAGYLTTALRMLDQVAASPERDEMELTLLSSLGSSLVATEGYASTAASRVWTRARLLCEVTRESARYLPVLAGSLVCHIVRAELEASRELANRYLRLAEEANDPTLRASGQWATGCNLFHFGMMKEARRHFEAALEEQREASPDSRRAFDFGPEIGVFCRSFLAHTLCVLGYPEEGVEESQKAIARAGDLSHPFSMALALAYAAMLHQFRDEPESAVQLAEKAAGLSRKYGFRYYLSWTPIICGWAQARRGSLTEGLAQMKEGFAALRATGGELRGPYYLGLIADACGKMERCDEGLAHLAEGFAAGQKSREAWAKPELERIRGDLLLQTGDRGEAEASYREALRLAREQGSRLFELRAATSLERLE